jgi:hypothetical protein
MGAAFLTPPRLVPSGPVEEQVFDKLRRRDGLRRLAADILEMQVHRLGVGIRQDQGRAGIATRAAAVKLEPSAGHSSLFRLPEPLAGLAHSRR